MHVCFDMADGCLACTPGKTDPVMYLAAFLCPKIVLLNPSAAVNGIKKIVSICGAQGVTVTHLHALMSRASTTNASPPLSRQFCGAWPRTDMSWMQDSVGEHVISCERE